MNRDQRLVEILQKLNPSLLELINDSAKHANHAHHLGGAPLTGETHYKLIIKSPLFKGLSRIDRQRLVLDLLKDEFKTGLHALEIKASSDDED